MYFKQKRGKYRGAGGFFSIMMHTRISWRVMAREYKFKGYTFYSEEEYNEAKKENETIEYIKARTDLGRTDTVIALYNRLIDRKVISTVIGLDFLKRLRGLALKDEMVQASKLRDLPDISASQKPRVKEKKALTKTQRLERENIGLKIIVIGLAVILIGMFVILLTGDLTPFKSIYEEQVMNEYAGWKQELTEKQKWIDEQMYYLEQNGIFYKD